ncbi:hypothetical protein GCK72_010097 [Caenorhabditis remanei]|uniref:Protein kinase domain-containing protein n=1 Tax=Caenorhabditis remanei TaxID=31234 RepID=A0A6A5H2B9_CAERE|nr:hypothetical protein GCK72_010097 [Caenorhabditis remanei]KAF1761838.1 hypothetical protein GCK72_010097 [Caenorhabditis remanei]
MDFPFEYVERACSYPSFNNHSVKKSAFDESIKKIGKLKPNDQAQSEEEEIYGEAHDTVVNVKEMELLNKIKELEKEAKKEEDVEKKKKDWVAYFSSSECSSSRSENIDSFDDTSETDVVENLFANEQEKVAMNLRKFKIMRKCCCTDSECKTNTEITISSSSSSTSTSSEEEGKSSPMTDGFESSEIESALKSMDPSSKETDSFSDEEMNIDDEIEHLENLLKDIVKREERGGRSQVEESDDSGEELDNMFDEQKSKAKTSSKSAENPNVEQATAVPMSISSTDSSTTCISSEISITDSIEISSSDPDMEDPEYDVGKFNWQSDDLYESSGTDSEIENLLELLRESMASVESVFSSGALVGDDSQLQREKMQNFKQPLPDSLETKKKKYAMLEEQDDYEKLVDISKQLWLVQQLDSGRICSVKLVNRKNPEPPNLQINIDRERRVLYELLPELSQPSHIARLLDIGFNNDYKFLVYEDLGMNLLTVFEQFGPALCPATIFLITYFTFNSIKELHSLDFVHCDIRPSSFSVIHYPFNIKICDYSKCVKKKPLLKTTDSMRPESFSPRIFHRKDGGFDQFVDFESWIYTMLYLCTSQGLPWFSDSQNMLERKETFFNDPTDFVYNGCADAIPMAATLISDSKVTYEDFLDQMNFIFSVDVMQFSDNTQPRLWSIKEFEEIRKSKRPESDDDNAIELIESHWNPLDESDSADGRDTDENEKGKNEKEKERKSKNEKKKMSVKEEKTAISSAELSSEQWSESSSGLEKKKMPTKPTILKIVPPPRSPPKKADYNMEASSATEQFSMPSAMPRGKPLTPVKVEKKKPPPPPAVEAPKAPKGKKNKRQLLTRQFMFEMNKDLNSAQSSISYDSSASSFSSWTSSTGSSEDLDIGEKAFKWSQKSGDESNVEFFEDLNPAEREAYRQYENMVAIRYQDNLAPSSSSEVDPLSDIDSEEKQVIIDELKKRDVALGWDMISNKDTSQEEIMPEDHPNEIVKRKKKDRKE